MESSVVGRLSDWDAADAPLAPLAQSQVEALADLKLGLEARPFPPHIVRSQDKSPENALSESGRSDGQSSSWLRSESGLFPAFCRLEAGETRIHTGQQFLQWIHQVETSLIDQESLPYRLYIEELERQKGVTLALQNQVSSCLGELSDLNSQYEAVSQKTTELHVACQDLLMEQTKLAETSSLLQEKLRVFQEYEKLQHKLGSPTLSVHSETFLPLLAKIDEAIASLLQHPHYKESSVYLLKYRAILTRALDMIRSFVKSCLDSATSAASQPAAVPALSSAPHTAFTLFYGKFRAAAPRMRHLIAETERRVGQGPEYEQLLADMEGHYLSCREKLLGPSVRTAVSQLLGVHSRDHCGLVRAGCAFLLHVCEDETQLHAQMFSPAQDDELDSRPALSGFLERLCLVLYDNLRPLIIQVSHLETLAELTAILRGEVLGQHCLAHPYLVAYRRIAAQMLQDVQERLVYRTSVYIRTDIIGYSPSPGDLAYPEKLEMMENIADHLARQQQQQQTEREKSHSRQNSTSSIASATSIEVGNITSRGGGGGGGMTGGGGGYSSHSPADLHGMWYPPVRRTLLTLSKLYRCLERPIFQGLSQEVLSACLESIQAAAQAIGNNPKKSRADGQLFEIKHLLILREQIVPFQVEFQVKETSLDFSKIKTAAVSLFNKRGEILSLNQNNALLEFLLEGTPGVQEHLRDSKKEVDRRLKFTCEQFIQESTSKIVGEVAAFNSKVETFYKMRGEKTAKLNCQPWAGENDLQQIVARAIRLLKSQVPIIQRKMQLYLANRETEFILFRPIRSSLLTTFLSLVSTLRAEYTIDQQTIVACPTQEQLASILTSVMLKPKTPTRPALSREVSLSPELTSSTSNLLNHSRENSIQKDGLDQIPEDRAEVNGGSQEGAAKTIPGQEAKPNQEQAAKPNGSQKDDGEEDCEPVVVTNGGGPADSLASYTDRD